VVTGLRKSGASPASAAAFFLGNPALNPAVLVFILLTPGLGWQWAVLRLVLAIGIVFGTAAIINRMTSKELVEMHKVHEASDDRAAPAPSGPLALRWLQSLGKLVLGLIPEYILMILALGAIRAFIFPKAGPELGNNLLVIIGLAIAGTLFAIPTAGEIPIIQTMRGFGMGAGPAGALLLTLAPVSLPSLIMVSKVFPKRVLATIGCSVLLAGIVAGVVAASFGL
jgi:uncharacterized membrane protein YraQ (UPF0718 family)